MNSMVKYEICLSKFFLSLQTKLYETDITAVSHFMNVAQEHTGNSF